MILTFNAQAQKRLKKLSTLVVCYLCLLVLLNNVRKKANCVDTDQTATD